MQSFERVLNARSSNYRRIFQYKHLGQAKEVLLDEERATISQGSTPSAC